MKKLRILMSNFTLAGRSGTETFLHDLSIELLHRGHEPHLFSMRCGKLSENLQERGIRVYSHPDDIDVIPDVLHCQHTFETFILINKFPNVPAIYVCHDRIIWFDAPPPFIESMTYVAVDHCCRERFAESCGSSDVNSQVIYNSVNLRRFKTQPAS